MSEDKTHQNGNNSEGKQEEQTITIQSDVISGAKFTDIDLSDFLQEELKRNNLVSMTHIQDLAMLHVIRGSDVAAKAHTGSGKSLAFLLPALDLIYRSKMRPHNGTGVIVIAPTRELALQLYKVAKQYACDRINVGLAVGGTSQQKETEKLAQGCPLVIATPGRLKDHLLNSVGFKVSNLFMVVLDEADRLLDLGFQDEITQIMRLLPNQGERQTCLFSATLSDRVLNIPGLNLKNSLVKLDADQDKTFTIRQCFTQAYIMCPLQLRFLLMYTFLKSKKKSKIIIFFSNCATVQFYSTFLRYIGLPSIYAISGQLKQSQRNQVAKEFAEVENGALLATNVAARGLDIPDVDYVIQFDPPDSVEDYVHRAGRACRGANPRPGTGILFLSEREMEFVEILRKTGLTLSEIEFPTKKIINVQHEMEDILYRNYNFVQLAQQAFRDTISAYANHSMKKIFDVSKLDYQQLSTSFGLRQIPRIDILLGIQKKAFLEQEKLKERELGNINGERGKKYKHSGARKHGQKK